MGWGGRDWVEERLDREVTQPLVNPIDQTDRIYNYTDKLKRYNFHPFLLFLDDLECDSDWTIPDHSFQPITVLRTFVLLLIFYSNIFKKAFYVLSIIIVTKHDNIKSADINFNSIINSRIKKSVRIYI